MSPDGFGKPPPEEKLLKLIRGRHPRPVSDTAARAVNPALAASAPRALSVSAAFRGLAWPMLAVWLLGGLLGVEVIVLAVQAVRPVRPVAVPGRLIVAQPIAPAPPAPPDLPMVSASVTRPLFAATAASEPAASPSAAMTAIAGRLTMRLTLMGIVAGDPPQAIIEDSESKKTFFVTAGQAVVEGAVVDQVLDNRVVLDVAGAKIELSL